MLQPLLLLPCTVSPGNRCVGHIELSVCLFPGVWRWRAGPGRAAAQADFSACLMEQGRVRALWPFLVWLCTRRVEHFYLAAAVAPGWEPLKQMEVPQQ